jgi:hypothetical protein
MRSSSGSRPIAQRFEFEANARGLTSISDGRAFDRTSLPP